MRVCSCTADPRSARQEGCALSRGSSPERRTSNHELPDRQESKTSTQGSRRLWYGVVLSSGPTHERRTRIGPATATEAYSIVLARAKSSSSAALHAAVCSMHAGSPPSWVRTSMPRTSYGGRHTAVLSYALAANQRVAEFRRDQPNRSHRGTDLQPVIASQVRRESPTSLQSDPRSLARGPSVEGSTAPALST